MRIIFKESGPPPLFREGILAPRDLATGECRELHLSAAQTQMAIVPSGPSHVIVNAAYTKQHMFVVACVDISCDAAGMAPHVFP